MEQESIYDWLWLLLVFGAGSRKIWKLLEQYETPQKVRQVLQTETDLPFIHEREQRSIRSITNEQIGKLSKIVRKNGLNWWRTMMKIIRNRFARFTIRR